jgi:hypothetical protein
MVVAMPNVIGIVAVTFAIDILKCDHVGVRTLQDVVVVRSDDQQRVVPVVAVGDVIEVSCRYPVSPAAPSACRSTVGCGPRP